MPLGVREALAAAATDGGAGGEGDTEALRFPLALGPAREEAGALSTTGSRIVSDLCGPIVQDA